MSNQELVQKLRLIERINELSNRWLTGSEKDKANIARSTETKEVLFLFLESMDQTSLAKDKDSFNKVKDSVNQILKAKPEDLTLINIGSLFSILRQILRDEDIPSDIDAIFEISEALGRANGAGQNSFQGSGGLRDPVYSTNSTEGLTKINGSYSGADVVPYIKLPNRSPLVIGTLSEISYSINRDKFPVGTLGTPVKKGYTRGSRTITGMLVFKLFDHAGVYNIMREYHEEGYPILFDEVPTFDIGLHMSNEYGSRSSKRIIGVEIFREGSSCSIDDIELQSAFEFYAIDIEPLRKEQSL